MSTTISEPDWKIFRHLREIALERFCQRVLTEIERIAADTTKSSHERYLAVIRLMKDRDEDLAGAFDNPRRSQALFQLGLIQARKLLTDEELMRFGPDTIEYVQRFLGVSTPG